MSTDDYRPMAEEGPKDYEIKKSFAEEINKHQTGGETIP